MAEQNPSGMGWDASYVNLTAPAVTLSRLPFDLVACPDEELVRRAVLGDKSAFAALVDRHRPLIEGLCRRICSRRVDADDAVQESLTAIWRGLAGYQGASKISTWIYRIVSREAVRVAQKSARGALLLEATDAESFGEPDGAPDPADRVSTEISIRRAINSLPLDHRVALILREWMDLPYEEIASIQFITPATARSRVFRAKAALHLLLTKADDV